MGAWLSQLPALWASSESRPCGSGALADVLSKSLMLTSGLWTLKAVLVKRSPAWLEGGNRGLQGGKGAAGEGACG